MNKAELVKALFKAHRRNEGLQDALLVITTFATRIFNDLRAKEVEPIVPMFGEIKWMLRGNNSVHCIWNGHEWVELDSEDGERVRRWAALSGPPPCT